MAFVQTTSVWLVFLACVDGGGVSPLYLDANNVCNICGRESSDIRPVLNSVNCNNINVEAIKDGAFANQNQLTEFTVENTNVSEVGDTAFCHTNIEKLILSKGYLSRVPNLRCISGTLKDLDLSENVIRHINDSLGFLTVLETLDISKNGLECAPYNLLCGTALNSLKLNENHLTSTLNFSCFHELMAVEMSKNDIHNIPLDSFKNVTVKNEIRLEYNQVDNVSALVQIAETTGSLYLIGNNLTCFNVVSVPVTEISLCMFYHNLDSKDFSGVVPFLPCQRRCLFCQSSFA